MDPKTLKVLGDIGAVGNAVTPIVGAAQGVMNLLGIGGNDAEEAAKQQYEMQRRLNQQQQEYARENAAMDYSRTRDLTTDKYALELQGKRDAGLSTTLADGTSVATPSVNPVAAPNAGSVGMPQTETDIQYKQMLSIGRLSEMFTHSANAVQDIQAKVMENQKTSATMMAYISKAISESNEAESKAILTRTLANIEQTYGMQSRQADTLIKQITAKYAEANEVAQINIAIEQYKNLREDRRRSKKEREFMDEQIKVLEKKRDLLVAQTTGQKLTNETIVPVAQSQINKNNAEAFKANQEGVTVQQLREPLVQLKESEAWKSQRDLIPTTAREFVQETLARLQNGYEVDDDLKKKAENVQELLVNASKDNTISEKKRNAAAAVNEQLQPLWQALGIALKAQENMIDGLGTVVPFVKPK